jgi:PST family polysaccharide transporter/lipopolysaccharide exporter
MRILAVWGLARSIGANIGPVFKSLGRPEIETKLQVLKVLVIVVTIYPATARWGLEGTATVIVGSSLLVTSPLGNYIALKQIDGSIFNFVKSVGVPLLASVAMAVCVYFVDIGIQLDGDLTRFVLLVFGGVVTYTSSIVVLTKAFKYELAGDVRIIVGGIKNENTDN